MATPVAQDARFLESVPSMWLAPALVNTAQVATIGVAAEFVHGI